MRVWTTKPDAHTVAVSEPSKEIARNATSLKACVRAHPHGRFD
jgi:hypothetical protein